MPFIMAGDPDLDTTEKALIALDEAGADVIELGVPYSVLTLLPSNAFLHPKCSPHSYKGAPTRGGFYK